MCDVHATLCQINNHLLFKGRNRCLLPTEQMAREKLVDITVDEVDLWMLDALASWEVA